MTRASALALMVLFTLGAPIHAQELKQQLVGTWSFVSSSGKLPDGSPVWGSNPKGLLIFTDNGRYSSHIVRSDRAKYTANSRLQGTPDEHKATVHGTIATFGTYSVDEANKSFIVRFEGSTYPNNEGVEQTRSVSIVGDELRIKNPGPTIGGPPTELVYRRAK